jgi:hypothetical protein
MFALMLQPAAAQGDRTAWVCTILLLQLLGSCRRYLHKQADDTQCAFDEACSYHQPGGSAAEVAATCDCAWGVLCCKRD